MAVSLANTNTSSNTLCTRGDDNICSSNNIKNEMMNYTECKDPSEALQVLMEESGCANELCVLYRHKNFLQYLKDLGLRSSLSHNIKMNFKPFGPITEDIWLSNEDIEGVLEQWKYHYPNFDYLMCDLMTFIRTSPVHREFDINKYDNVKSIATVLNTAYRLPGEHWVAVYIDIDADKGTIEYFDSTGNPPKKEVIIWIDKIKKQMKERQMKVSTPINTMRHQRTGGNCGVYCLYYILCRLRGLSRDDIFSSNRVPENLMTVFRSHLFRNTKYK